MRHNVLSQFKAKSLPAGKHADGQGLWLVKRDSERGKWILRLADAGKRKEMGLGRWPDVSIAEARERASAARRTQRDGNCPVETRRKARVPVHRITVEQAVQGAFQAVQASLKGDGQNGKWLSPLSIHVLPKIGTMPIEDVDQHVLKHVLDPIWNVKCETAAKALYRMNMAMKHAAALGLEVDLQATMKARALLGKQRHEEEHIPALAYTEVPAFYKWIKGQAGVPALALRFVLLTLARTTELRLAEHSEFYGDVWLLPETRAKTGVARRIPLVGEAVEALKLCTAEKYLFPAVRGKPISDMAMSMLMRRAGYEARPHGFRASFRTWAEECTDADYETKETCLGHAVDLGIVAAYQRSDRLEKRRKLLEQWEAFLVA